MDNVLLTPHIGGSTREAQENIALDVAAKLVRYSDNGSTMGAVNFPEVTLPDHAGARRIMHIHRNEPGVLQAINTIFSSAGINIAAQYLQTLPDVGYVVMDVEAPDSPALVAELDACRPLFGPAFCTEDGSHGATLGVGWTIRSWNWSASLMVVDGHDLCAGIQPGR
jgi:hypothetical protein